MTKPSGKNNLVDLILAAKGLEGIEDENIFFVRCSTKTRGVNIHVNVLIHKDKCH